ncbi:MAG: NAD+ synthase [Sphingobacterium sp.]
MKIALSQLNYHIANFEQNAQKIIAHIEEAKQSGAELIVFSELAIGGYPAKDLLRSGAFLQKCYTSIEDISQACQGIACIIGAPVPNKLGEGKPLFNAAVLLENGAVKSVTNKTLLPDYDVFNEYRYFEPNRQINCIDFHGYKIALTICEDLWDDDRTNSYVGDMMQEIAQENPDLIINIAASPFTSSHFEKRKDVLYRNVIKTGAPLLYINQVGAHTDLIFDGRSLAINRKAETILELKSFEEDLQYVHLQNEDLIAEQPYKEQNRSEIALIHQALILGIRDYFIKSGFKQAVLGLSGGLDSAVVAALACEALGADNVLAVLMPSVYSTDHSLKDALDLVANTGCRHQIIPIQSVATAFEESLAATFKDKPIDTTEENIQARIRGTLLMAISNKFGHILLNTSNKSEAAVGYGTLYGDMAGSISVIGDLYKTQAFQLARYINRDREIIPINTIIKPPSAELRPDQKDSDSLPDYELLDAVLFQLIEMERTQEEVVKLGFQEALVKKVDHMLTNTEFKRFQAPPILRISSKAFGAGRLMPLVAKHSF